MKAAVGVVGAIFIILVGIILMQALYEINPLVALLGIGLLIVLAFAVVVGFVRSL